jgi:hypothetical protein
VLVGGCRKLFGACRIRTNWSESVPDSQVSQSDMKVVLVSRLPRNYLGIWGLETSHEAQVIVPSASMEFLGGL